MRRRCSNCALHEELEGWRKSISRHGNLIPGQHTVLPKMKAKLEYYPKVSDFLYFNNKANCELNAAAEGNLSQFFMCRNIPISCCKAVQDSNVSKTLEIT